ncbi:MAG TPA: acyl carrier protein [Aeromonadales bacterium]|nr:acyl carrier protein [Aeromonadales bacterium]
MEDLTKVISNFIVTQIMHGSNDDKLDDNCQLLDEGILDSLGLQQLITFLEGKYDIIVEDDYLMPEYFTSVKTIAELIQNLMD